MLLKVVGTRRVIANIEVNMTTDNLKKLLGNYKWSLLVTAMMFLMMVFGYQLARYVDEGAHKKVVAQQETIAILSKENDALTTRVNQLEVAKDLATLETESITHTINELRKSFETQEELLAFYERVMVPEKSEGSLQIEGVEVYRLANNQYQLRFVLLQSKKNKAVINGDLNISVKGAKNGQMVTVTHGDDNFVDKPVKYRFRFFQAVNLTFTLPETLTPESLNFSTAYYQYKTRKGKYDLSVKWNDALATNTQ